MARGNFEACLVQILRHEGGFADHPADPGGATNLGITRAVLAEWRGRPVSRDDVRSLTRSEAAAIYRRRYWDAIDGDSLPAGVDLASFDYAVNSGPVRALRALQSVRSADAAATVRELCAQRRGFLGRLKIFAVFGRGWLRRVAAVEAAALAMAEGRASSPSRQGKTGTMDRSKSMFESRTVWANLIGLAAILASIFGFNTGLIDQNALVDSILSAMAGVSFVASTLFRVIATRKIG